MGLKDNTRAHLEALAEGVAAVSSVEEGLRHGAELARASPDLVTVTKTDVVRVCEKLQKKAEKLASDYNDFQSSVRNMEDALYSAGLDLKDVPRIEFWREGRNTQDNLIDIAARLKLMIGKVTKAPKN
jgi:hypothetical protein